MNIELSEERLKIHVRGLDSSIRLMGQQLAQSPNGPLTLKNLLPDLIILSQELDQLDKDIDAAKEIKKIEGTSV